MDDKLAVHMYVLHVRTLCKFSKLTFYQTLFILCMYIASHSKHFSYWNSTKHRIIANYIACM